MLQILQFNPWLTVAAFSWIMAQGFKVILDMITNRKFDAGRVIETGGMPSSHTAFVMGLSTSVGITEGWQSVMFAVVICFALIVIYDATNLRRDAGHQAALLNKLVGQLLHGKILHEQFSFRQLKELLGHNPLEVVVGAVLGIGVALILHSTVLL
jgi:acid phosphatase family membrane protein YuiD